MKLLVYDEDINKNIVDISENTDVDVEKQTLKQNTKTRVVLQQCIIR